MTSACAGAKLSIRAATVATATRRLLADGVIDAAGEGLPECLGYDYLIRLKGIGPYAAAHCRVLLHDFSRLPVDSGVIADLRERYGCDPESSPRAVLLGTLSGTWLPALRTTR